MCGHNLLLTMFSQHFIPFFALLFVCFTGSEGERCTIRSYSYYSGYSYTYRYCPYGCCGGSFNQECCTNDYRVDIPVIVGAVFGALIGLTIIITIIIVLIKTLCHSKREVQPLPAPEPTVNMAYMGTSSQYPMQQMPPPPPAYTASAHGTAVVSTPQATIVTSAQ